MDDNRENGKPPMDLDTMGDFEGIKRHNWFAEWLDHYSNNPVRLVVAEEGYGDYCQIIIIAITDKEIKAYFGGDGAESQAKGKLLFFGEPDRGMQRRFSNAWRLLKELFGFNQLESLALMAFLVLVVNDYFRSQQGQDPLLRESEMDVLEPDADFRSLLGIQQLADSLGNMPVFSIESLVTVWEYVEEYFAAFCNEWATDDDDISRRPHFRIIPPIWVSVKNVSDAWNSEIIIPESPDVIDPAKYRLIQELPSIYRELGEVGLLSGDHAAEQKAEETENEPEFKHSSDYRSIIYGGKQYTLTAPQAAAVKILHENYENGTPDVGHESILTEIDSLSNRLRDVFKSRLKFWKELIRKGESKGTYRLNI